TRLRWSLQTLEHIERNCIAVHAYRIVLARIRWFGYGYGQKSIIVTPVGKLHMVFKVVISRRQRGESNHVARRCRTDAHEVIPCTYIVRCAAKAGKKIER